MSGGRNEGKPSEKVVPERDGRLWRVAGLESDRWRWRMVCAVHSCFDLCICSAESWSNLQL